MMMRTTRGERERAESLSAAIDELIRDPLAALPELGVEDGALLGTARSLASLLPPLGPAVPALEQQVLRGARVRARQPLSSRRLRSRWLRLAWATVGLAVLVIALGLFTPMGQTALASIMAVFRLGRTEVRITPAQTAAPRATAQVRSTGVPHSMTLAEAEQQAAFPVLQPAFLPEGYVLKSVTGYVYADLPAWVPQPFSLALVYGDAQGREVTLSLYPITLGERDKLNTSALNLEVAPIQEVRQVSVGDRPGVLLSLGTGRKPAWREVVWEQGNLILSLSTGDLDQEKLLQMAASVR